MKAALHAEWTKLRTVRGCLWLLVGMAAVTVAASAAATSVSTCSSPGCGGDVTLLSLFGVEFGQALAAVLAVLVIGGEYGSGMIRATVAAVPRRGVVFAAKSVVVSGVVVAAGTVAVLGSLLAGRFVLPGRGFTAAHGHAPPSLADGPTLRAAAGSVLYLVLIALIGLGVAAVVRDSATGIGLVLGLLYLLPVIGGVVGDPGLRRVLATFAPTSAGLGVRATTDLAGLPLAPWAGLAVTAGWAAVALTVGGVLLKARDV
ncbi:ABC transporter permease [Phytomonospora endophytica]|uniref:ABC-2 type transport system permease protein n=1 Tax=Phytomonospora endophytica TaxID=714109 RepID=A0A841FZT9_9ACTN|nr:ABC transporter permease [Phytomonospora endophytica]MBB6037959.1 ABC-2 type transport system permease protein [Phytomonospora endophytica]GIG68859.1 ABC transporter [Phytomonospora endophytica]